jgi:hypothetical protein
MIIMMIGLEDFLTEAIDLDMVDLVIAIFLI